jgi:hypothetical protein
MNHIDISVKRYDTTEYVEYEPAIDGCALSEWLDKHTADTNDERIKSFIRPFTTLLPAWSFALDWYGDILFTWKLLRMDEAPVPVLMCEGDADYSCIVIVAEVEKTEDYVYWNRIGYVNHDNESFDEEKRMGILCTEAYSDEDWQKYGDNIALEEVDSDGWCQWISEHWTEELFRRRMNYTLPYYRTEGSITWFADTEWVFDRREYESMLKRYEILQRRNLAEYQMDTTTKKKSKEECAEIISQFLPGGTKLLDQHYNDYGEMLIHIFASEAISEPLIELISNPNSSEEELELYTDAIRFMLLHGDENVLNALYVTVYERLCDENEAFKKRGINLEQLIPD